MSKNKQLKDLPAGRSLAIINRKMCQPYLGLDINPLLRGVDPDLSGDGVCNMWYIYT